MRGVPAWISPVIVGSAGAVLAARWNDIPARFATHWDAHGNVNGWSGRDSMVFFPVAIGLGLWLLFEVIALAVRATKRQKPVQEPIAAATTDMLRLVTIALSLLFAFLAIALPFGPVVEPRVVVFGFLAAVLLAIVVGAVRISRAIREARAHDPALAGWRGFYYANPDDERLWVPKLLGMGWTLNFSHRWAWPVMLVLLGVPIGFTILLLVALH